MNLGFSGNCSEGFSSVSHGIKKFRVIDHDLHKSKNLLAKKLNYLTVSNITINSELPNSNLKQSILFANCYFTFD